MRNVMIIPAKANSIRIPGKNLKLFCGLPLFLWSVIQGVAAKSVAEVWVSTDSDEIESLAHQYGAKVFRRKYVDEEHTPGWVPVREWTLWADKKGIIDSRGTVITRLCTTPHLMPTDIDKCMEMFWYNKGVYGSHNIGMAAPTRTHVVSRKVAPGISMHIPEATCHNDWSIIHHLAFCSITYCAKSLRDAKGLVDDNPDTRLNAGHRPGYYYPVHDWQMQDCDTEEEWEFGELIMEHYILKGRTAEEVYGKQGS